MLAAAAEKLPLRGAILVTGTDTGVGKTIVTAAIAAAAGAAGLRVAVVKPAQTGQDSDVDVVARLASPATARTLSSYPHPLAPAAAARVAGLPPLRLPAVIAAVRALALEHDLVIIEGAGGLLVPVGPAGSADPASDAQWTVADLGAALGAPTVVVARAGLGTLNHTALTLEALARRGIDALVVIGAWPAEPQLVHRTNLADLPGELAGVLPERAGTLIPASFRAGAPAWLSPVLHGHLDAAELRGPRGRGSTL